MTAAGCGRVYSRPGQEPAAEAGVQRGWIGIDPTGKKGTPGDAVHSPQWLLSPVGA